MEAAASWELAARTGRGSGFPKEIEALLTSAYGTPTLLLGIAEHKVSLPGGNAASQSDVWGLVQTPSGIVSLTIEAKAKESFGNESVRKWLARGKSDRARANRQERWKAIQESLPAAVDGEYVDVAYQLLHRCASAVIEAKRFHLTHAACIVQAFETPKKRFKEFSDFCKVIGITVPRDGIATTIADGVELAIGWADCQLASHKQIVDVT